MRARHRAPLVAGWAIGGAGLGLVAELVLPDLAAPVGTAAGAFLGAAGGWLAVRAAGARSRPPVWVELVPRAAIQLSLFGVGGLLTLWASPVVGVPVLGIGVWTGLGGRRPLARDRLAGAVAGLSGGAVGRGAALAALERLVGAAWVPAEIRSEAAFHRGSWALFHDDGEGALRWLRQARHPRVLPFTRSVEALVHVLDGEEHVATRALADAFSSSDRDVRARAEGVRLLLVMRTDGPADVLRLGGPLLSSDRVDPLSVAMLACAHLRSGDAHAAATLLPPTVRDLLQELGLVRLVPEVREAVDGAAAA